MKFQPINSPLRSLVPVRSGSRRLTVSNRSTANAWSSATHVSLSRCFLLCKKNLIHAMCTVCRSSEGSSTCCNPRSLDPGCASSILLFMNSTCAYCIQNYRLIYDNIRNSLRNIIRNIIRNEYHITRNIIRNIIRNSIRTK